VAVVVRFWKGSKALIVTYTVSTDSIDVLVAVVVDNACLGRSVVTPSG